jgi:hypothetical protein
VKVTGFYDLGPLPNPYYYGDWVLLLTHDNLIAGRSILSEDEEPARIRAKIKHGREQKSPLDRIVEAGGINLEHARCTGVPIGKTRPLDEEDD